MKIKTSVRYLNILLRMNKIRNTPTPNAGKDVDQQELSFTAGGSSKWCRQFGRPLVVSYKSKQTPIT